MASLYKVLINGGYVVLCPNLLYEGIDCQVIVERDLIMHDCQMQLTYSNFAIFVLAEGQEMSDFVKEEVEHCYNRNIKHQIFYY